MAVVVDVRKKLVARSLLMKKRITAAPYLGGWSGDGQAVVLDDEADR